MNEDWQIGNDTPCWTKRHVYFIHRTVDGNKEYVNTPGGRLRTWRTNEGAAKHLRAMAKQGHAVASYGVRPCPA